MRIQFYSTNAHAGTEVMMGPGLCVFWSEGEGEGKGNGGEGKEKE